MTAASADAVQRRGDIERRELRSNMSVIIRIDLSLYDMKISSASNYG